jgi:hypothetical protein
MLSIFVCLRRKATTLENFQSVETCTLTQQILSATALLRPALLAVASLSCAE